MRPNLIVCHDVANLDADVLYALKYRIPPLPLTPCSGVPMTHLHGVVHYRILARRRSVDRLLDSVDRRCSVVGSASRSVARLFALTKTVRRRLCTRCTIRGVADRAGAGKSGRRSSEDLGSSLKSWWSNRRARFSARG